MPHHVVRSRSASRKSAYRPWRKPLIVLIDYGGGGAPSLTVITKFEFAFLAENMSRASGFQKSCFNRRQKYARLMAEGICPRTSHDLWE
ncbi:hypothetical protein [Scytonema sp. NUACC21]